VAAPEPSTLPERLRDEVRELTRELIRIDTSNPPGGESIAAEFLAGWLAEAGVEAELAGPDPERLNLIARIAGAGEGPSLMLMAHTDVVPAPADGWTVPPFAGELRGGRVIGRGAADMKGELASRVVAFAEIARSGERPAGDVVLLAESDEERNTYDVGMSWLVRERPDIRCDYALNEGGGILLELADGRRVVTISIGEKQVASLRLRFHGRAGHASVPAGADNVLRRAADAVQRLLDYDPPARLTPPIASALEGLGAPVEAGAGAAIDWAASQHQVLAGLFPAMTRMTVTPTGLQTHEPPNVIPPLAEVICDCRALPGQTLDDVRDHVERALGGIEHELELLEPLTGGTESAVGTPLYELCAEHVRERLPGAELLPVVTPGFSDSHWVRDAFGTIAYGFAPVFATPLDVYLDGAHGADESIEVDDLAEMTALNLRAIRSLGA